MKSKKLLWAIIPMFALVGMSLSACGGPGDGTDTDNPIPENPENPTPENPENPNPEEPVMKNKVEVVLASTAGKSNQVVLEKIIEEFKEVEPNITIVNKKVEGNYAAMAKNVIDGFATGEHPDMTLVYPDAVADFIDYGFAFNLEDYMHNETYGWTEEEFNDIVPEFLKEGQKYVMEGTYSLPFSKSTEVIYYNADKIFGIKLSGVNNGNPINEAYMNSLTWEEFFGNLCPKIIAYSNTAEGASLFDKSDDKYAVLGYDSDANFFITLCEQYGIPYTSIDASGTGSADFGTPESKTLLENLNKFTKEHYIVTQKGIGENVDKYFKANKTLFSIGSTGGASYQYDTKNPTKLYVAPVPQAKGKDKKVILQGPSMAFLKHRKGTKWDEDRQLASWLFYKFATTHENSLLWSTETNYLPIRTSVYESDDYKDTYDESAISDKKSYDALTARIANLAPNLTSYYFTSPAFKGSNTCRTAVEAMVGKACTATNDAKDAQKWLDDAITESNKAIG